MADPRQDPPLKSDTNRSLWIGWGAQGVSLGLAILMGGVFFGYLFVFGSMVMVIRGWKPGWFMDHFDAQLVAGLPYRRAPSLKRWSLWVVIVLLLSASATWTHHQLFPEAPGLAKTVIDGVKKLLPPPANSTAAPHDQEATGAIDTNRGIPSSVPASNHTPTTPPEVPSLVFLYRDHRIEVNNMSKRELVMSGSKLGDGPISMDKESTVLPVQPYNYHINADSYEREVLLKFGPNGNLRTLYHLFLSDSGGHKWTVTCELWAVIRNGELTVETRNLGTEKG
jgi:hypothetical protein